MEVRFENVWGRPNKPVQAVKQVWSGLFQMNEQEQEKRIDELVFVGWNRLNQPVAISSARQVYVKQFRNNFLGVRFLLLPGNRFPGLMSKLVMLTRDFLEANHPDSCIGLIALIENEEMKRSLRAPVLSSGFVYAGNSAAGYHIRVYYFKGARIA